MCQVDIFSDREFPEEYGILRWLEGQVSRMQVQVHMRAIS